MNDTELKKIARAYKVRLMIWTPSLLRKHGLDPSYYENRSFSAGRLGSTPPPDIEVGLYDDPELRTASFFHELGHLVDERKHRSTIALERGAWEIGFLIAEQHGVKISSRVRAWAKRQLKTYHDYK